MSHVFISYSSKDKAYARQIAARLLAEGFDVWIDNQRLRRSEDWWRAISLAVRGCAAVVVILTPNSDNSKWVQREITLAERYNKPLFPLWLDGDIETPNWDIFVRTQIEDVRGGELPPDEFYDHLGEFAPRRDTHGMDITQPLQPPKEAPAPEPPITPPEFEIPASEPDITPPPIEVVASEPDITPPPVEIPPPELDVTPPPIEAVASESESAPREAETPSDEPESAPLEEAIEFPATEPEMPAVEPEASATFSEAEVSLDGLSQSVSVELEPEPEAPPAAIIPSVMRADEPELDELGQTQPILWSQEQAAQRARTAAMPFIRNRNLVIGAAAAAALIFMLILASSLNPGRGAATATPTNTLSAFPTRTSAAGLDAQPAATTQSALMATPTQFVPSVTPPPTLTPFLTTAPTNVQLIADFEVAPVSADTPLTREFINRSSGFISSYQWDFGDGTTSINPHPVHYYTQPGVYFVVLTISGPDGSNTFSQQIEVVAAPTADPPPGFECTYTVQAGDTFIRIALDYNLTLNELLVANLLSDADVIELGQVLYVPCEAAALPTPNPQSVSGPPSILITSEVQNVRAGPGVIYNILGQLRKDDTAVVIGSDASLTWVVIDFRGQQGWLTTSILTVNGDLNTTPIIAAPPTPTPVDTASPTPPQAIVTATTAPALVSFNTPLNADNVRLGMVIESDCRWLSADGRFAVTFSGIYRLEDREEVSGGNSFTLLSPDGRWIAYPDGPGIFGREAVETVPDDALWWGGSLFNIDTPPRAFSPDGSLLVSGDTVYSTISRQAIYENPNFSTQAGLIFSPDSQLLMIGDWVLDADTGASLYSTESRWDNVFSADSRYLAVLDDGIYEAHTGNRVADLPITDFFRFSPDGTFYAARPEGGGNVEVRRTTTGELITEFYDPENSIRFSPDGLRIGVNGYSLYRFAISAFTREDDTIGNYAFSADNLYTAIGGNPDYVRSGGLYREGGTSALLFSFEGSTPLFNPDATLLAVSDNALYSVPDGRQVLNLLGTPLAFSADGSVLAMNYLGDCLLYWANDRPRFVGTLDLSNANVRSAPFLDATRIGGYSGDDVAVIGRTRDFQWYKILVNGFSVPSVWVSASAVTNVNVPDSVPILES